MGPSSGDPVPADLNVVRGKELSDKAVVVWAAGLYLCQGGLMSEVVEGRDYILSQKGDFGTFPRFVGYG